MLKKILRQGTGIFIAEALSVPMLLLLAGICTRTLTTADFGIYSLVMVFVASAEWTINGALSRSSIREIAGSANKVQTLFQVLRAYRMAVLVASVILGTTSIFLSWWWGMTFFTYILIALPALFFSCQSNGYKNYALVEGHIRLIQTAILLKHTVRLFSAIVLFWFFPSPASGIVAYLSGNLAEMICYLYRFGFRKTPANAAWQRLFWRQSLLLIISTASLRLYSFIDVYLLQTYSRDTAEAGLYVAAQNFGLMLMLISLAFHPLILAKLSSGIDEPGKQAIVQGMLRFYLLLLPVIVSVCLFREEFLHLIYGAEYRAASFYFIWILAGSYCMALLNFGTAVMIATGQLRKSVILCCVFVFIALVADISVLQFINAEVFVMTHHLQVVLPALLSFFFVTKIIKVKMPGRSLLEVVLICGVLIFLKLAAGSWNLFYQLCTIFLALPALYLLLMRKQVLRLWKNLSFLLTKQNKS